MADGSIRYNGEVVNSTVSEIQSVATKFPPISSEIKAATNKITSARGFQKYIGSISSDAFSSYVDACSQAVTDLAHTIQQKQIEILAYSENTDDINAFLNTLSNSDYQALDLSSIDSYISTGRKIGNFFRGIGSDVVTFGMGILEGVMDLGETAADLVVLEGTLLASPFVKGYDWITGSDAVGQMWNNTKAYVSEKHVENIFNGIYRDTEFGQNIQNNAYGFNNVRTVGSGLGYSAGIIGVSVLTGGLAASLGAGGGITAGNFALTAGAAGYSSGVEEAWSDGASLQAGLQYGIANASWEATQWYVGAGITQAGGVASRIALNTANSAADGFVKPALSMIYKDYEGATVVDKYQTAFEAAGGWKNVAVSAGAGLAGSMIGEVSGARRLLKQSSSSTDLAIIGSNEANDVFRGGSYSNSSSIPRLGTGLIDDATSQVAQNGALVPVYDTSVDWIASGNMPSNALAVAGDVSALPPVSVAGMTVARAEAGNLFQGSNLGLSGTGTIDLLSLGKGPIVDSSSIGNKHGSGSSVGSSGGTNPFAAIQQLIDTPTADGQVTIPENILNDSNVMVIPNSGDTIMYDQTAKQWYRQETNGNKTMISNDVFNSDGLKDISKRVVLDSSRDVYVDQVTGMETPRVPTYTWDDNKGSVKKHSLTGEKNSHKYPTGLHYGDEMIRQINDGTVFPVKDDGEKILDAVSAAKTSDGGIAVTRADSSVVTFKPNDDGLVSMGWGYTNRPQLVKMPSSTLFPLDYTEDDIKDCVNAFLSPDADKRIVHMGGYIAKGQRHYSTEYEFVYTKDGKKLLLGAQVNDDILRSIYPIDKNLTVQQRPNSYK